VQLRRTKKEAESLGDVNLADQFVGADEAIKRIADATSKLRGTDPSSPASWRNWGAAANQQGAPLLQQVTEAQKAYAVAQGASQSLNISAEKAQETLANRIDKTKESYLAFFRTLSDDSGFKKIAEGALYLADTFRTVLDVVKNLALPLAALGTASVLRSAFSGAPILSGFAAGLTQNVPTARARATGGRVDEQYTLVGEQGPELVSLPRGSYVHTAGQTRAMYAGGGSVDRDALLRAREGRGTEGQTFVSKVLGRFQEGKPGISSAPAEQMIGAIPVDGHEIVYRGPDGLPVAAAVLVNDGNGLSVKDFATDKSRGLLASRAAVSVGREIVSLGAARTSGTMSGDAAQLLEHFKQAGVIEGYARGGPVRMAGGGWVVPGHGDSDSVPADLEKGSYVLRKSSAKKIAALLTPGEIVLPPEQARKVGLNNLDFMNKTGRLPFARGGLAGPFEFADYRDNPGIAQGASEEAARLKVALTNATQIMVEFTKAGPIFRGLAQAAQQAGESLKGKGGAKAGDLAGLLSKLTPAQASLYADHLPSIDRAIERVAGGADPTGELYEAGSRSLVKAVVQTKRAPEDFRPGGFVRRGVLSRAGYIAQRAERRLGGGNLLQGASRDPDPADAAERNEQEALGHLPKGSLSFDDRKERLAARLGVPVDVVEELLPTKPGPASTSLAAMERLSDERLRGRVGQRYEKKTGKVLFPGPLENVASYAPPSPLSPSALAGSGGTNLGGLVPPGTYGPSGFGGPPGGVPPFGGSGGGPSPSPPGGSPSSGAGSRPSSLSPEVCPPTVFPPTSPPTSGRAATPPYPCRFTRGAGGYRPPTSSGKSTRGTGPLMYSRRN
jgi:hypothetical protein